MTVDNDNTLGVCFGDKPSKLQPILLRPREAAQVLAISPRKLWELTDIGEIRCIRIGRSVRYSVEDLRQWTRAQGQSMAEP